METKRLSISLGGISISKSSHIKQIERLFDYTPTEDVNKRYCFTYRQHGRHNYENYTFWTDGEMTIKDTPIGAGHRAKKTISVFRHTYQDGCLTIDIKNATWFVVIRHVDSKLSSLYAKNLLFALPSADLSAIQAKIASDRSA